LSIGAAYGVIVAIFQWGWGKGAIGLQSTLPIPAYVPMLVFCIVFGLSMDYEVFLLSRVHEAWLATGDAHRSVAIGIGATARVILVPAIMSLLGAHAWWLPRWLAPVVPDLRLEGELGGEPDADRQRAQ
jgi:putative drug exporter of the RND superfamily